ncbi:MAG: hypothetical protein V1246_10440 [Arenicellales bacterium]|nr:hypothetical protein [Arenicellales bacterium]
MPPRPTEQRAYAGRLHYFARGGGDFGAPPVHNTPRSLMAEKIPTCQGS